MRIIAYTQYSTFELDLLNSSSPEAAFLLFYELVEAFLHAPCEALGGPDCEWLFLS